MPWCFFILNLLKVCDCAQISKSVYNIFLLSLQIILSMLRDHHSDASTTSSDSDINIVVEDEEKEDDDGELGVKLEDVVRQFFFVLSPPPRSLKIKKMHLYRIGFF